MMAVYSALCPRGASWQSSSRPLSGMGASVHGQDLAAYERRRCEIKQSIHNFGNFSQTWVTIAVF
jgi:hypothetical protein